MNITRCTEGCEPHEPWVAGDGLQAVRRFEAPLAGANPTMTRHGLDRDTEGFGLRRARRRASDVPAGAVVSPFLRKAA